MSVPQDYRYTENHEWVRIEEGNIVTVGITDYAQEHLGEVVSVELPRIGDEMQKGEILAMVDSQKASAEVYTPVSGVVIEVNSLPDEDPSVINNDPHDEGWLAKIEMETPDELDDMMNAEEYDEYISNISEED